MSQRQIRFALLLLAVTALPLTGCGRGVTQGTSYFPHIFPAGDVVQTHAKPGGPSYYANFDPHAVKIEVFPIEATNPVRTQHVFIATVLDENGQPRRNRRVEWMLEGVGNIIEVDESGVFNGRGGKVNNEYAVSYTDYHEQLITRGNNDPSDDFVIKPGQTWCVVSSAVEGDSHMTVFCPEIYDWDRHKVFVTKHWVDAEWVFPKPAVNRAGTTHVFTTSIMRHTDHQPLAGYKVRYKIVDGPPAYFVEARNVGQPGSAPGSAAGSDGQEWTTVTDLNGNANVTLAQVAPTIGVNRIDVEIIRPPVAGVASGVGIVIGKGTTTKEWQAPQIQLTKEGPPTAVLNGEVRYLLTIANTGQVETKSLTVKDTIPQTLTVVRSDPPHQQVGTDLVWTLGELQGGQSRTIEVIFKSTQLGKVTNTAQVESEEGLKDKKTVTTEIVSPDLKVTKTGPPTGVVGTPITYEITVTNAGTGPATNVLLQDKFAEGLEHESKANPIELPVGTLEANQTKTVRLTLMPRKAGRLVNVVDATAEGGLRAHAEHPVDVTEAKLQLKLEGPPEKFRYVKRPADYKLTVVNPGEAPLNNVVVRDQLPPQLKFKEASDNGQLQGTEVVWALGTLPPRGEKVLQVKTTCEAMTPEAVNVAVGTADPGVQARDQAALEIRGLPAFRFEVEDVGGDPVEKGGKVNYTITVTNQGSLPGNQVQVFGTLPKQMRFVSANGPSAHKTEALPTRKAEEGDTITFAAVDSLPPGETFTYVIEAQAMEAGDVRFAAKLKAMQLVTTVTEEESTNIYEPPPGTQPGGAAAPSPPPPAPDPVAPPAPPPGPGLTSRPQPTTGGVVPAGAKVPVATTPSRTPSATPPRPGPAPAILREPAGAVPLPPR